MAIDWTAFDNVVLTLVRNGTGLADPKVIFAFQATPRPGTPYAEVNPRFAIRRQGVRDENSPDPVTPGKTNYIARRDVTVACRFLGPGANALAEALTEYVQTEGARADLFVSGATILDPGSVKNLTELLDTTWQEEAALDLVLSYTGVYSETPGIIDHVGLAGSLKKPDGTTVPSAQTIGP